MEYKDKRIQYLDILRVIAISSITMNHAVSRSFSTSSNTLEEYLVLPLYLTIVKTIIYIFSRLGVPLFLMITGALLLERDYMDSKVMNRFLKHNLLSLFITTEIWLAIMFWYLKLPSMSQWIHQPIKTLCQFIMNQLFFNQTTMGSMWYMPMILCLYLILPLIAVGVQRFDAKLIGGIYILLLFGSMIINNANVTLVLLGINHTLKFQLSPFYLISPYCLFVIPGYYISHGLLDKWKTKSIVSIVLISFTLTVLFQVWIYSSEYDYSVVYQDIGPLVTAVFLFELVRRIKDLPQWMQSKIEVLSRMSFGIYFVHICIMTGLVWVITKDTLSYLPRFIVLEVVSFGGSVLLIKGFGSMAWCRKWLFRMS